MPLKLPPTVTFKTYPLIHLHRLPNLVTLRGAATAMGVSTRTLRRRIQDGSLRAHRMRGRLYVKPEEVRAFLERHLEVLVE